MEKIRKSFEEKKTKKLFFLWQKNSKSFEKKKTRTGKTQIALLGHAPWIRTRKRMVLGESTVQEES